MIQLSAVLNLHLPRVINSNFALFYLDSLFSRDERHNDYRFVDWRTLLNHAEDFSQLNLILSELHLREIHIIDNLILHRIWNVDDLILYARSLIIYQKRFKLTYCFFFFQRITENLKITINEYKVHQEKQLRLKFDVRNGEYNYSMHVLFSHMSRTANDITHLINFLQETWINQIILSVLWISIDSNVHQ